MMLIMARALSLYLFWYLMYATSRPSKITITALFSFKYMFWCFKGIETERIIKLAQVFTVSKDFTISQPPEAQGFLIPNIIYNTIIYILYIPSIIQWFKLHCKLLWKIVFYFSFHILICLCLALSPE